MRVLCTLLMAAGLGMAQAAAAQQPSPAAPTIPVAQPATLAGDEPAMSSGPRRAEPAWAAPVVRAPLDPAGAAVADSTAAPANDVIVRRGSRGEFFLYMVGLVVVGGATYKLGEATDIEALQSVGGFMATAGLLAIIIPIWLFF